MRSPTRIAITLALLAGSAQALAITAQSGIYLSTVAGYGAPEVAKTGELSNGDTSSSSTIGSFAWGMSSGFNIALNSHWLAGLEIAYDPYDGKAVYDFNPGQQLSMTSYDYDATANATYLFSNGFNFFGKAGLASLTQTYSVTNLDGAITNITRTRPIMRAGVGYLYDLGASGSLNVFAEYTHIFAQNGRAADVALDTEMISVDILQGGVAYTFPV